MAPSEGSEGASKRKRQPLSPHSSEEEALDFIRDEALGPKNAGVFEKLLARWQANGDVIDGELLWTADEQELRALGCSPTVAQKIARAVEAVKAAAAATQELAPTTQQLAANGQQHDEEPQQEQQQLAANGWRTVRREPPRRPPTTQLEPSPLPNGGQETQAAAAQQEQQEQQEDGQEQEEEEREEEQEEEEEQQQGSEGQPPQMQHVQVKPDPEQLEAEIAAWQEELAQQAQQASQQQGSQRRSQRRSSGRRLANGGGSAMETDETAESGEEDSQQADGQDEDYQEEEEEEAEEEEEEEEEEHVLANNRRRRSVRVKKEEPQELPTGAAGASQQAQHTQQQQQTPAAARRQRTPQAEQAGPSGGGAAAAAAAAGGSGRMLTRRQRQQQEDAVLAATRRTARAATLAERQRRQEQDEAQRMSDDELEDEQAAQDDQQVGSDEEEEDPLVQEDLGPEAPQGHYRHDWQRRCRWGLQEIFSSMSVDELRELIEAEEEGGWPDFVLKALQQKKKVDGVTVWVDHKTAKPIANKLTNYLLTGNLEGKQGEDGDGGMRRQDIADLLKRRCDEAVRMYVHHVLRKRYQNLPRYNDPHKLMWKLWRFPDGPAEGEVEVVLGSRKLRCERIQGVEPGEDNTVPFRFVTACIRDQRILLEERDDENLTLWIQHLGDLTGHPKFKVLARVFREPGNSYIKFTLFQLFTNDSLSASLVSGTWKKQNSDAAEGEAEESLIAVDVAFLMSCLDETVNTPFAEQIDTLCAAYLKTQEEVGAKGVEVELSLDNPISFKQFDKCMTCVEDLDRPEPPEFQQECDDAFLLTLRPYQRRSLAHMLHEERAQGGSARHLWVQYNLPQNPEIYCYVSPILHQIRCSTSKIEMEQWIGAKGGAGWIALQMGMGKTACAVGAIQMNPPPEGWRANRAYQGLRLRDHLSAIENNMPHGGTLIVMPPTLIDQWEDEIRKTTQADLTVLKWTENTKGAPRTLDCKEIAKYDIVLSTFPLATQLHTLSHIRWWRIIADEPQLQAGGFLADKEHRWFANHKWLLTGTPINATVESISPSMQFLGMGQFDMLFHHYPAVITHVLKKYMVRYTKRGSVDGEPNLILPPLTERVIECTLCEEDERMYHQLKTEQRLAYRNILDKLSIDPDLLGDGDPAYDNYKRHKLNSKMIKLRGMVTTLRKAASSALKQDTGIEHFDEERDRYVKEKYWYTSKAEAVIEILNQREQEEKTIIFSEYPDCLRQIKKLLPDIGLQSRDLIGGGSAAARGKAIRAFQTDPPTRVFLITHRAGGAGVTLTAGTHIILCEPTLNPSFARQAIGRSHRMGQEHPVTVTRLLMKSTIEEKIAAFAARWEPEGDEDEEMAAALDDEEGEGMRLASTALEANAAANDETSKLTIEDLRDMLNNIDDDDA